MSNAYPNKLYPAHPLTFYQLVCIEVERSAIQSKDISGVLTFAKLFESTAENAWNAKGLITLSFSGYDRDPRELWEIPEVRAYVKKLTKAWPTWMFFLDSTLHSLTTCYMCLCGVERTEDPNKHCVVSIPREVLDRGFDGITHICNKYKFGEDYRLEVLRKVTRKFDLQIFEDAIDLAVNVDVTESAA